MHYFSLAALLLSHIYNNIIYYNNVTIYDNIYEVVLLMLILLLCIYSIKPILLYPQIDITRAFL